MRAGREFNLCRALCHSISLRFQRAREIVAALAPVYEILFEISVLVIKDVCIGVQMNLFQIYRTFLKKPVCIIILFLMQKFQTRDSRFDLTIFRLLKNVTVIFFFPYISDETHTYLLYFKLPCNEGQSNYI